MDSNSFGFTHLAPNLINFDIVFPAYLYIYSFEGKNRASLFPHFILTPDRGEEVTLSDLLAI